MDVLTRLSRSAIVPVVVLDDAKGAVSTAHALLDGGIDAMEIASALRQRRMPLLRLPPSARIIVL